ncbi:unnamed protein product [Coccothraustes coccothraustes]
MCVDSSSWKVFPEVFGDNLHLTPALPMLLPCSEQLQPQEMLSCWQLSEIPQNCCLVLCISLKRDSRDCFQMFASSPPAGRGGCGELGDGNQNAEQMERGSLGVARIWPRGAGTAAPPCGILRRYLLDSGDAPWQEGNDDSDSVFLEG